MKRIKKKYEKKNIDRYDNDECYRVRQIYRKKIIYIITCVRDLKGKYAGTKYECVAKWLEYNFTDEMNWENHGTVWDADHVIPICKWDLKNPEEIELCFDWKNVSPLECQENRCDKREKVSEKQLKRHIKRLKQYFEENKLNNDELNEYIEKYNKKIETIA